MKKTLKFISILSILLVFMASCENDYINFEKDYESFEIEIYNPYFREIYIKTNAFYGNCRLESKQSKVYKCYNHDFFLYATDEVKYGGIIGFNDYNDGYSIQTDTTFFVEYGKRYEWIVGNNNIIKEDSINSMIIGRWNTTAYIQDSDLYYIKFNDDGTGEWSGIYAYWRDYPGIFKFYWTLENEEVRDPMEITIEWDKYENLKNNDMSEPSTMDNDYKFYIWSDVIKFKNYEYEKEI